MSRYANYTQSQYLIFIDSTDQEPKSANVGSFLVITDRTTGERIIKRWSGSSWDLDFEFNDPIDGTYRAPDGTISYVQIRANEFGYMIPIEYIHELVHEKKVELISYTFLDVPNGETRAIEIVPSVDYDIHIPDVSFNGDLKTRFFSYENYTTSIPATGQLATSNRVIGANGLNGTINYWASNVTVTGTQRTNEFSGSNSPSARAGGSRVDGIETVATYGNPIIIVVQNSGGAGTSDIHITINFYERPASIVVP